jgi:hypothetical protein
VQKNCHEKFTTTIQAIGDDAAAIEHVIATALLGGYSSIHSSIRLWYGNSKIA